MTSSKQVGWFVWTIANGRFTYHKQIYGGASVGQATQDHKEGINVTVAQFALTASEWEWNIDALAIKYPLTPELEAQFPDAKRGH